MMTFFAESWMENFLKQGYIHSKQLWGGQQEKEEAYRGGRWPSTPNFGSTIEILIRR